MSNMSNTTNTTNTMTKHIFENEINVVKNFIEKLKNKPGCEVRSWNYNTEKHFLDVEMKIYDEHLNFYVDWSWLGFTFEELQMKTYL